MRGEPRRAGKICDGNFLETILDDLQIFRRIFGQGCAGRWTEEEDTKHISALDEACNAKGWCTAPGIKVTAISDDE